jgi:hypothetical protein
MNACVPATPCLFGKPCFTWCACLRLRLSACLCAFVRACSVEEHNLSAVAAFHLQHKNALGAARTLAAQVLAAQECERAQTIQAYGAFGAKQRAAFAELDKAAVAGSSRTAACVAALAQETADFTTSATKQFQQFAAENLAAVNKISTGAYATYSCACM